MQGRGFLIAAIKREVAQHYRIPVAAMSDPARGGAERNRFTRAHPRQVAMCLATRLTEHSLTRIGQFFGGRDRKTVWHGMKVAQERDKKALRVLTKRLLIEAGPCV